MNTTKLSLKISPIIKAKITISLNGNVYYTHVYYRKYFHYTYIIHINKNVNIVIWTNGDDFGFNLVPKLVI